MARPFDPRKVLKQIANPLLREFFTRRGELTDVPSDDLTEHKIDAIFEAWQALPERQKVEVQVILRDVYELADHRGRAVLAEEILWRCPERAAEFEAQASKADNAMWVYLNVPEAFEEAAMFARADALAAGRYWNRRNSLPKKVLDVDQHVCDRLAQALTSFYGPTQMRGRHCHVVHYRRSGGGDYFFAYLDDYPDKHLVFDGNSDQPVVRSDRYAFENVFVYNAGDGSMELFAQGGKKVWEPLQTAFCEAVLDEDVDPADPMRPAYQLDHLLAPDFPLPTDPADGVEEARITLLRIAPPGSGGCPESMRVEVTAEMCIGWHVDGDGLAKALSDAMDLRSRPKAIVPGRLWRLGRTSWRRTTREVVLATRLHDADAAAVAAHIGPGGRSIVYVPRDAPDERVTYVFMRRFHRAEFEKWTQMDRLFCLFVSIGCGPFGLIATGIIAVLMKLQATDWADEEAKW